MMFVLNGLADQGAAAQNLVLVLALLLAFGLGYGIRDTRRWRRTRRRDRAVRWYAHHAAAEQAAAKSATD